MDTLGHERFGHGPEPVIVLHEFFGSLRAWDPLRPYLDVERFHFVFADVRGYGASLRLEGEYTAAEIARDVEALADALGADHYHLVGHSMTGLAAQHAMASDGGRRIRTVTAVTPVPTDGFEADEATAAFFRATIEDDEAFGKVIGGLTGDRWGEPFVRFKRRMNRSTSRPEVMAAYLERMIFPRGFAAEAAEAAVQTPLLVIAGKHDFPGMRLADLQASMNGAFPRVEWVELAEAGHYPMDESPMALAQALDAFLKRAQNGEK